MVDQQLTNILWVFMVDLGIFLLELCIFFCVRKHRGDALFNHHAAQKNLVKIAFDPEDLKQSYLTEIDFMASREIRERSTLVDIKNEEAPRIDSADSDDFADTRFNEIGQRHGATIAVIKRRDFKSKGITTPMLLNSSSKHQFNMPE